MPDQEFTTKVWNDAVLDVYGDDGIRSRRLKLSDVHIMVRGEGVEYAIVTGRVENVQLGPPRRGRPRKSA